MHTSFTTFGNLFHRNGFRPYAEGMGKDMNAKRVEGIAIAALFAGWLGLVAYLLSGNDTFLDRIPDGAGGTLAKVLISLGALLAPFFFGGVARAISAGLPSKRGKQ